MKREFIDDDDQISHDYENLVLRLKREKFYSYLLISVSGFLGLFILGILDLIFQANALLLAIAIFFIILSYYFSDIFSKESEPIYDKLLLVTSFIFIIIGYNKGAAIEFPLIIYTISFIHLQNLKLFGRRLGRVEKDWYRFVQDILNVSYQKNISKYLEDRLEWNMTTTVLTAMIFVPVYSLTAMIANNFFSDTIETISLVLFLIFILPLFFKVPKPSEEFNLEQSKKDILQVNLMET